MSETTDKSGKRPSADPAKAENRPLLGLQIPKQSPPKADNMLLDLRETEA